MRIARADALIADSCYEAAIKVLEAGAALHPRSGELQHELREARSMLSEQHYFEGLERAEEAAKLSRNLLRCERLGEIPACDDALALRPDDPGILIAKADALAQADRPADALDVYEQARRLRPDDAALAGKMAAAESGRQKFFDRCQSQTGTIALQACQAALLRGADDEFMIHKRKGILLQSANQAPAALDAYIAANMLDRGDRSVALAIVTLSESTGRRDALTLAARGAALLSLDRATEALTPLRRALSLSPGLPEIKSQLARAEAKAKAEAGARDERALAASAGTARRDEPSAAQDDPPRRYSNAVAPTRSH